MNLGGKSTLSPLFCISLPSILFPQVCHPSDEGINDKMLGDKCSIRRERLKVKEIIFLVE